MSDSLIQAAYEINGKAAASDAFYAMACNPAQSVCVEACAGAGKTWMLIERMVKALELGAQPDQILAITFTKKAAGEMRGRLQERLASPELAALRAQVLASGRSVQILTFHAWFAQIFKAAPLSFLQKEGYPLHAELIEQEIELLPELRQIFYAAALADGGLRADLGALIEELGRSNIDDALVGLLAKRTEFELADSQGLIERSVMDSEPHVLNLAQLAELAKRLGVYKGKKQQTAAGELETALTAGDVVAIKDALLTDKNTRRVLTSKDMSDADVWVLEQAQNDVLKMLAAQHQHVCWLYQQRMTRIGRVWLASFAKLKFDKGLVDMSDLERAATTLLSNSDMASSVQERLDQRLRHVMIDEFQDTNPLQWQAIHAWLASYAGSGGGQSRPSLFIVGDPKQSIYRFRRAEPRVFLAAQDFMHEAFDAALLSCDHTRRSSQAVLRVANGAMLDALQANEYQGFRAHTTQSTTVGAALCLPMITRDKKAGAVESDEWRDSLSQPKCDAEESLKEFEADQAARWIAAQLGASQEPLSVMVLARKHASLALMQHALQRCAIASSQQEKQLLADVPAVQDVIALMSALVSPHSDLDLARALKSPIFGWTDEGLMALRVQQLAAIHSIEADKKSWFDLLQGETQSQLRRWQTWLHRLPPHDALQAIYDDGDVLNKYLAAMPSAIRDSSHAALESLLSAALQQGGGRYLTAYAFVRAMRAASQTMKAPSMPSQSVQLLTIHGAKGLEADVVLLLDSDLKSQNAKSMTTLVDWQPEEPRPRKFVFLLSESAPPACVEALLDADFRAREVEELNSLYVAVTRARRILAISATKANHPNPKSVWNRLQAFCEPVLMVDEMPANPRSVSPVRIPPAERQQKAPQTVLTLPDFEQPVALAEVKSDAAKLGSALHRLLQWQNTDDAAVAAVAREFGLTLEQAQTQKTRAHIMNSGESAWIWDAAKIDWQANEYELVHEERVLRIDRLVKERSTQMWWIIDFKSATHPEKSAALQEQLKVYRMAVSAAFNAPLSHIQLAFVTGEGRFQVMNRSVHNC